MLLARIFPMRMSESLESFFPSLLSLSDVCIVMMMMVMVCVFVGWEDANPANITICNNNIIHMMIDYLIATQLDDTHPHPPVWVVIASNMPRMVRMEGKWNLLLLHHTSNLMSVISHDIISHNIIHHQSKHDHSFIFCSHFVVDFVGSCHCCWQWLLSSLLVGGGGIGRCCFCFFIVQGSIAVRLTFLLEHEGGPSRLHKAFSPSCP